MGVISKGIGFAFWESVQQGALCAASKLQNVHVQWDGVTAETNVTGQINLLTNYITQGVNSLVYAATEAKALVQATNHALQVKTPADTTDSVTNTKPPNVPPPAN